MNPVSGLAASTGMPAPEPQEKKIAGAARDFEGVLLNMLVKSLQQSFSQLPGGTHPVGSDSYRDFESEALSSSLAAADALGIARLISDNLKRTGGLRDGPAPKVLPAAGR